MFSWNSINFITFTDFPTIDLIVCSVAEMHFSRFSLYLIKLLRQRSKLQFQYFALHVKWFHSKMFVERKIYLAIVAMMISDGNSIGNRSNKILILMHSFWIRGIDFFPVFLLFNWFNSKRIIFFIFFFFFRLSDFSRAQCFWIQFFFYRLKCNLIHLKCFYNFPRLSLFIVSFTVFKKKFSSLGIVSRFFHWLFLSFRLIQSTTLVLSYSRSSLKRNKINENDRNVRVRVRKWN